MRLRLGLGFLKNLIGSVSSTFDFTGSIPDGWSIARSGNTATYRDNNGDWQIASANTIRIDHDVDGNLLGARVEPTRKNLANFSNFSPSNIGGISVVSGDGVASVVDDSANLAGVLLDGSPFEGLRNGNVIQLTGGTAGTTYRISLNAESNNNHSYRIIACNKGSGYSGNVKMSNGVAVNNWSSTQNLYHEIKSENFATGTTRYLQALVTTGRTVYILAVQFEEGAYMSSPIVTSGTAGATRPLDLISYDSINSAPWSSLNNGSLVPEVILEQVGTINHHIISVGSDANNYLGISCDITTGDIIGHDLVASSDYQNTAIYPMVEDEITKVGLSWGSGESTILSKPMKYNSANSVPSRVTADKLYIGSNFSSQAMSGWLKSLKIYNSNLSLSKLGEAIYGHTINAPQSLSGTTRTYTFSYVTGGQVLMECDAVGVADVTQNAEDYFSLNVSNSINVILQFPPQLRFAGVYLQNGNNVIIDPEYTGAHLKAVAPASSTSRALLRINHQAGGVYINNILLDCDDKHGMDAIEMGAGGFQSGESFFPTDYFNIQNTKCMGLYNPNPDTYHSDGVQWYGSCTALNLINVDIETNTQGAFLPPQSHNVEIERLTNVAIWPQDPDVCNAYPLTLWESSQPLKPTTIELNNVYVGERTNEGNPFSYPADELFGLYSVNPRVGVSYGAVEATPGVLTWPLLDGNGVTLVTGAVYKWTDETFSPSLLGTEVNYIAPNAPTSLILSDTGNEITASWTAPTSNGSDVWGYLFKYRPTGSGIEGWDETITRTTSVSVDQININDPLAITSLPSGDYDVEVYAMAEFYDSVALTGTITIA